MGCFTLNNITIQRGCNYECDDPKDCSIRDQATVGSLPPLKNSDKKGKGDICLCTGNLCNNIWWSGGSIFGFVVAGIAGLIIVFGFCAIIFDKCC